MVTSRSVLGHVASPSVSACQYWDSEFQTPASPLAPPLPLPHTIQARSRPLFDRPTLFRRAVSLCSSVPLPRFLHGDTMPLAKSVSHLRSAVAPFTSAWFKSLIDLRYFGDRDNGWFLLTCNETHTSVEPLDRLANCLFTGCHFLGCHVNRPLLQPRKAC